MAVMNINQSQFEEMMGRDKPMLAAFSAPWCGYCRRIAAAYDRVAGEYEDRLNVVKIDIDEEMQLAQRERIEVIPTLVIYRKGEAVASIVAPESRAMIDRFIREALEQ